MCCEEQYIFIGSIIEYIIKLCYTNMFIKKKLSSPDTYNEYITLKVIEQNLNLFES